VSIRELRPDDWPAVRAIYEAGIRGGDATFETETPTWERWDAAHPELRLVAERAGAVVGWAALSPASSRHCYRGVGEVSVYVAENERGTGLGRALLDRLVELSEQAGYWTLTAGVFPENEASLRLHRTCGFREVGVRERPAELRGVWRDVVLLERRSTLVGTLRHQFVDCRWELGSPARGRELYLAGHIPRASFLDVDEDLSDLAIENAGRHPLPSAEKFAAAAGRAGIGAGVYVVAYGNGGGPERLWWLLRHFGHDDCAVLLGGIESWGGELRAGEEEVERAEFVPQERSGDTIAAEEIARRLADPSLALVDARTPNRWRGEPNEIDDPPGRIPGAANAPWNELLPELEDGELVAYCGSGVTACVTLHRAWLAGREGRLYPGSWSEWSQRGLPLERG
jgi:3-mercaptopyruvate sulfurtransferase SseA/L-amino acid N-acyltransferase YncA